MSNKYQKGQIYKIVDVGFNKCYIGSTTETLSQRMTRHRAYYFKYLRDNRDRVYLTSSILFDEFGVENCKIEWIEDYPCNSKKELEAREGKHQKENDCVNKIIVGRTVQEYREDNKEKISQNAKIYKVKHKEELKQYREDNAEHFKQKAKERYNEKKEEINKKHREHYTQNLATAKARHKRNYELNRERVLANQAIKINCGCGAVCRKGDKARHQKCKKNIRNG